MHFSDLIVIILSKEAFSQRNPAQMPAVDGDILPKTRLLLEGPQDVG